MLPAGRQSGAGVHQALLPCLRTLQCGRVVPPLERLQTLQVGVPPPPAPPLESGRGCTLPQTPGQTAAAPAHLSGPPSHQAHHTQHVHGGGVLHEGSSTGHHHAAVPHHINPPAHGVCTDDGGRVCPLPGRLVATAWLPPSPPPPVAATATLPWQQPQVLRQRGMESTTP